MLAIAMTEDETLGDHPYLEKAGFSVAYAYADQVFDTVRPFEHDRVASPQFLLAGQREFGKKDNPSTLHGECFRNCEKESQL